LNRGEKKECSPFKNDAINKASMLLSNLVAGLQISRINSKDDFKVIQTQIIEDLKP
jgi:hypothetical protein